MVLIMTLFLCEVITCNVSPIGVSSWGFYLCEAEALTWTLHTPIPHSQLNLLTWIKEGQRKTTGRLKYFQSTDVRVCKQQRQREARGLMRRGGRESMRQSLTSNTHTSQPSSQQHGVSVNIQKPTRQTKLSSEGVTLNTKLTEVTHLKRIYCRSLLPKKV